MTPTLEKQRQGTVRYWIQEYNPSGDNWVDYLGFSPDTPRDIAFRRTVSTCKAWPTATFRLIERTDVVIS